MQNRGINGLNSESRSLDGPQAVSVAIDLMSERSPHPQPPSFLLLLVLLPPFVHHEPINIRELARSGVST